MKIQIYIEWRINNNLDYYFKDDYNRMKKVDLNCGIQYCPKRNHNYCPTCGQHLLLMEEALYNGRI